MASERRHTSFPIETILSVTDGAKVHRGVAMAIKMHGEDVLVMAPTMGQLKKVFEKQFPGDTLVEEACHRTVLIAQKHATLDDEL